jgi:hypothetical protein
MSSMETSKKKAFPFYVNISQSYSSITPKETSERNVP